MTTVKNKNVGQKGRYQMRISIEALGLQEPAVSTRSSPTIARNHLC